MSRSSSDAPGSVLVTASFPAAPTSARDMRRLLREAVDGRIRPDLLDTATLLSTELITNAATGAGDEPVVFRVLCDDRGQLRVEVTDSRPGRPRVVDRGLEAQTGRGLLLVEALADSWGVTPRRDGKVVWFVLQS